MQTGKVKSSFTSVAVYLFEAQKMQLQLIEPLQGINSSMKNTILQAVL